MIPQLQWFTMLAALVYPTNPGEALAAFRLFIPHMSEIPSWAYTNGSLNRVATHKRRMGIPSFDEIRAPMLAWIADNKPPLLPAQSESDGDKWDRRSAELRAEWDDPAGIRARVATCQGEERYLPLLRAIVGKWAPQHAWIIPPPPGSIVTKETS